MEVLLVIWYDGILLNFLSDSSVINLSFGLLGVSFLSVGFFFQVFIPLALALWCAERSHLDSDYQAVRDLLWSLVVISRGL